MSSPNVNRKLLAKQAALGKGNSVSEQRTHHRNEFINRLKSLRIREVDKLRQICNTGIGYESLVEIRKLLLSSRESKELVEDLEEYDKIIKSVELELLEMQFEQYEMDNLKETESLANAHLKYSCNVCDALILEGVLCEQCKVHFTSPF